MALTEINSLRSKTMKVFDKAPGERVYRCHIGNIHYPDTFKVFQDIDTTLNAQAGGVYQDKCFYHCEVPDKADGVFGFYNRDHHFSLKLVGVSSVGYTPVPGIWGALGKGYRYKDAFGSGIHFEVIAKNMSYEKRICFEKPPPDITKDFSFEYEIVDTPGRLEFKSSMGGATTIIDPSKVVSEAISIENKITQIYSSTGKYKSLIHFPRCHDSNPDNKKRLPVRIMFYMSGGKTYLRKTIPKEIFKDAVYPVYADDPVRYDPPAGDGFIQSAYASWNISHDNTTGAAYPSSVIENEAGVFRSTPNAAIMRAFIPIDTSGIADGDTVTAATLYMYGFSANDSDNDANAFVSTVQTDQASTTTLVNDDYNNCGATDNPTEGNDVGARIDITNWNSAGYNTIALNATGLGWVSKTGVTMLGLRSGHDIVDVAVNANGGTRVKFRPGEYTGTAQDPYLDVTASAGSTPQAVGGHAMVISGVLNRQGYKDAGGHSITIVGSLVRGSFKDTGAHAMVITGALATASTFIQTVGEHTMVIAGTLSRVTTYIRAVGAHAMVITGSLVKKTTIYIGNHIMVIIGSLIRGSFKDTGGHSMTITGILSTAAVLGQIVGGYSMTIAGTLVKTTSKTVGEYALTIAGSLVKGTSKSVGGHATIITGVLGAVAIILRATGGHSMTITGILGTAAVIGQTVGGYATTIAGSLATQFTAGSGAAAVRRVKWLVTLIRGIRK